MASTRSKRPLSDADAATAAAAVVADVSSLPVDLRREVLADATCADVARLARTGRAAQPLVDEARRLCAALRREAARLCDDLDSYGVLLFASMARVWHRYWDTLHVDGVPDGPWLVVAGTGETEHELRMSTLRTYGFHMDRRATPNAAEQINAMAAYVRAALRAGGDGGGWLVFANPRRRAVDVGGVMRMVPTPVPDAIARVTTALAALPNTGARRVATSALLYAALSPDGALDAAALRAAIAQLLTFDVVADDAAARAALDARGFASTAWLDGMARAARAWSRVGAYDVLRAPQSRVTLAQARRLLDELGVDTAAASAMAGGVVAPTGVVVAEYRTDVTSMNKKATRRASPTWTTPTGARCATDWQRTAAGERAAYPTRR